MPDLASVKEIAEILGVSIRTAHRAVDRDDFPTPLGQTAGGRVWWREDIERWAKKHPPRGRGRPKRNQ